MIQIEKFNLQEALNQLPSYQSKTIQVLIDKHGEENAAKIWIESNGPKEISHNGGTTQIISQDSSYWQRLKEQFNSFVCGNENYSDERKQAIAIGETGATSLAAYLAGIISPIIGISVPILVPAILLLLHLAAKMGIGAYCANKNIIK